MKRETLIVTTLASICSFGLTAPVYATGAPASPAKPTVTKKATSKQPKLQVVKQKPGTIVVTRVVERIHEKPLIIRENIVYVPQYQYNGKANDDVSNVRVNNNSQRLNTDEVLDANSVSSSHSGGNDQTRMPPAPAPLAFPIYRQRGASINVVCPDPLEIILVQIKPFKKARMLHPGMYRMIGNGQDTFLTIPGEHPEISLYNEGEIPRISVGTIVKLQGKRGYEYYVLALDYPLDDAEIDARELKPARKDYYEIPSRSNYAPTPEPVQPKDDRRR